MIQAINAVADTAPTVVYTALQQRVIARAQADKDKKLPFDDFAVQHRFHLRQQGGETGLTQLEWEELTSSKLLRSVVLSRPDPRVGELLKNSTVYERTEFYKALTKQEILMKRYGHDLVEDALEEARKISVTRALAAMKLKEEAATEETKEETKEEAKEDGNEEAKEDGMVPEF